jgi:hypothetical protein
MSVHSRLYPASVAAARERRRTLSRYGHRENVSYAMEKSNLLSPLVLVIASA